MARFRLRPPVIKLVENDIEKQCLTALRYAGYCPIRLPVGKFKTPDDRWITVGEPGLPDYVIPAFFLETKRPGGTLRDSQIQKIWELEKSWNLETLVIDDVNVLHEWLNKHPKKR